jgi:hypothetical protein
MERIKAEFEKKLEFKAWLESWRMKEGQSTGLAHCFFICPTMGADQIVKTGRA